MRRWIRFWMSLLLAGSSACRASDAGDAVVSGAGATPAVAQKLAQYTPVRLTADLSTLSERERRMIPLLIRAAQEMDTIFWQQVYPGRDSLLGALRDSATQAYARLNYGPWDRLDDNVPFLPGVGPRPPGAAFYPSDMTKEEFEAAAKASPAAGASLRSLYTLVRRDSSGRLVAVPYREAFAEPSRRAAASLREAATLAEDSGLKRYLELRARALETDEYRASDLAWMDMKRNGLDIVIGPIETYDDALFGYKAAHEAYVLIKDRRWSERLARYAKLLPALQRGLPVPDEYKRERPGTDSDLNAYDAVYYTGQANAGSKTIAVNLPNDEKVQLEKGTRRLQLKNTMRAKFDRILVPIGEELIAEEQRKHIEFDSFFANVMFHEVAHGLGIKQTIAGTGTVRDALKEQAGALEEGKADILGLYMITRLQQQGELPGVDLDDNYVTFLAGIFRSIRFGAASAHGRANAAELSFLQEHGAFTRDSATGRYRVDFPKMRTAVDSMAARILRYQGDGDYEGVTRFMSERATIPAALQRDLDRLGSKGIPVDIVFEQGLDVLGASR
ncbi:MAG: Zn-dependent hydrolase [Gemmatimonadales bacterium]|nr:Zn-dependent hydrolase [Gemmatimonadales bacterium]